MAPCPIWSVTDPTNAGSMISILTRISSSSFPKSFSGLIASGIVLVITAFLDREPFIEAKFKGGFVIFPFDKKMF
jgi:hypothetical protein